MRGVETKPSGVHCCGGRGRGHDHSVDDHMISLLCVARTGPPRVTPEKLEIIGVGIWPGNPGIAECTDGIAYAYPVVGYARMGRSATGPMSRRGERTPKERSWGAGPPWIHLSSHHIGSQECGWSHHGSQMCRGGNYFWRVSASERTKFLV